MSKVVLYGSIIGVVYMFYKTYKRMETPANKSE